VAGIMRWLDLQEKAEDNPDSDASCRR
jgi:hypothetical protein